MTRETNTQTDRQTGKERYGDRERVREAIDIQRDKEQVRDSDAELRQKADAKKERERHSMTEVISFFIQFLIVQNNVSNHE